MEEKKKFEKLVFEDIDKAQSVYRNKRNNERPDFEKELANTPRAKELLVKWNKVQKEVKAINEELRKANFEIATSYGDNAPTVRTMYGGRNVKAVAYDKETSKKAEGFEELKRNYTLKIYAGDIAEMMSLFVDLQKELQAIMK